MTSQDVHWSEAVFTEVGKDNKGKTELWICPEIQEKLCLRWEKNIFSVQADAHD